MDKRDVVEEDNPVLKDSFGGSQLAKLVRGHALNNKVAGLIPTRKKTLLSN